MALVSEEDLQKIVELRSSFLFRLQGAEPRQVPHILAHASFGELTDLAHVLHHIVAGTVEISPLALEELQKKKRVYGELEDFGDDAYLRLLLGGDRENPSEEQVRPRLLQVLQGLKTVYGYALSTLL